MPFLVQIIWPATDHSADRMPAAATQNATRASDVPVTITVGQPCFRIGRGSSIVYAALVHVSMLLLCTPSELGTSCAYFKGKSSIQLCDACLVWQLPATDGRAELQGASFNLCCQALIGMTCRRSSKCKHSLTCT